MDIRETRFTYEIHSNIEFDEVINEVQKELNLQKGILRYFSYEDDKMIEEELYFNELKEKALDRFDEDE